MGGKHGGWHVHSDMLQVGPMLVSCQLSELEIIGKNPVNVGLQGGIGGVRVMEGRHGGWRVHSDMSRVRPILVSC